MIKGTCQSKLQKIRKILVKQGVPEDEKLWQILAITQGVSS